MSRDLFGNEIPIHENRTCNPAECKGKLYREEAANGTGKVRAWCFQCRRSHIGKRFISKKELAPKVFEALPPWPGQEDAWRACEACKKVGPVELHHWAPHHLFKDSESWPTSYLCGPCHIRWHDTVTPNMTGRAK